MLVVDNKPEVRPLVFLATRWDSTSSAPKQKVLTQWTGLAPEDTSCEDWFDLKATYHLEDKVWSDTHENVKAKTKEV